MTSLISNLIVSFDMECSNTWWLCTKEVVRSIFEMFVFMFGQLIKVYWKMSMIYFMMSFHAIQVVDGALHYNDEYVDQFKLKGAFVVFSDIDGCGLQMVLCEGLYMKTSRKIL